MSRSRWSVVVFALLASLLIVAAQPAAASHLGPEVVSSHSTAADFNQASLTNMTVVGSGTSATVELSGSGTSFEDGFESDALDSGVPDNWEVIASPDSQEVTTTQADEGSQSWYVDRNSGTQGQYRPSEQPYSGAKTENISFSLYQSTDYDTNDDLAVTLKESGDSLIIVGLQNGGNLRYWDGDWHVINTSTGLNEWVRITIFDIDPVADTVSVEWETDANSGVKTGLSLNTPMTNGYDETEIRNKLSAGYIDDFSIGSSTPSTPAEYLHNHSAEDTIEGFANISTADNVTITATWRGDSTGNGVYDTLLNQTSGITSATNHSFTWPKFSGDDVRLNLTVESSGTNEAFALESEGVLANTAAPSVNNLSASPTGELTQTTPIFEIDINDSDFGTVQGDSVTAELFIDGQSEGTDTLTNNGTASVTASTLTGGSHTYNWTVNDSYGHSTTSQDFSVSAPGNVTIRNVTPPHDIIDSASVDILISGSGDTVDKQTVSDGNISMEGLPTNESYIFVIDAPNYHLRSAVIKDIYQQETVFLLNESHASVEVAFEVTDLTGRYSSPLLMIDRVINRSLYDSSQPEEFQWTTIGGDRLGADARFVIDLEQDARYQITVENQEGDTRILGEYTAQFTETVELEVGDITWDVPLSDDYRYQVNQTELDNGNERITFLYEDTSDNTSELCLTIHERGNVSNVLYPENCFTDLGTVKVTQDVTGSDLNTTWVANWSATHDGNEIGSGVPLGQASEIALPIDGRWLGPAVFIVLIAGLSAAPKTGARTGALVVVAMAFGLVWWGWVDIPGPALGIAGALAILGKAADFNNPYQ